MTDIAGSSVPAQIESVQFNNPISEASLSSIGAVGNYLLNILAPVGTVWGSMLFDSGDGSHPSNSFQSQLGSGNPSPATWVLADGRDVTGSRYQALTGNSTVPDLRGLMLRGSNYGGSAAGTRADGKQNPDGTLAPGTYSADKFASHKHTFATDYVLDTNTGSRGAGSDGDQYGTNPVQLDNQIQINNTGGNETAPKTVTLNFFIRIN